MFPALTPFKLYAALGLAIILSAIVGVGWHKYNHALSRASAAEGALITYKALETAKSDAVALENAEKLKQASLQVVAAIKTSDELLAKFNLANVDRSQLSQKVSVLNASINQNEAVAARTRANLNDSVRLSASRDSLAASQESSAAERLSAADSHLATFRDACRLTTVDLVKAYAIIEADTIACGREQ